MLLTTKGKFSLQENQTPPCPTLVHNFLMSSYRAPFETSEYQFLEKVIYPFFYKPSKFYSKELVSGLSEFFRKKSTFCFGNKIHHVGSEFPQDYEYAIQKILRSLVLELLPKNGNQVRFDQVRLGQVRLVNQVRIRLGQVSQVRLVKLGQVRLVMLGQGYQI